MLEVLFAHAAQNAVFLLAVRLGILLGALCQLMLWLRRKLPVLRWGWDALWALGGLAAGLTVVWRSGDGLRGYALLGLIVGALLYSAGIGWLLTALMQRAGRICGKILLYKKENISGAGNK